jgi:hypothetical protein
VTVSRYLRRELGFVEDYGFIRKPESPTALHDLENALGSVIARIIWIGEKG